MVCMNVSQKQNKYMKINIKNIIRLIILLPLSIYSLYSIYYFITNDIKPTYIDCGIVKSKSHDDIIIKYGTETELYLNIQFKKLVLNL